MTQKHWLGVYHADYRKLKNQARFIQEIIDGVLVVSKKRKDVLVQELRDRKYEAFPRGEDVKKKGAKDDQDGSDNEDKDDVGEGGARDYDYLLGVRLKPCCGHNVALTLTMNSIDAHLVPDCRTP